MVALTTRSTQKLRISSRSIEQIATSIGQIHVTLK